MKKGILILSHRGGSFAQELIRVVRSQGLEAYVLSSQPALQHKERSKSLEDKSDWYRETIVTDLTLPEIMNSLAMLQSLKAEPVACISVWEGYRDLMAQVNENLGAPDVRPDVLDGLLDKYQMRKKLRALGLSQVGSTLVTENSLELLKEGSRRKFIKPRRGLASFGAFSLCSDLTWKEVLALREEMKSDVDYRAVFGEEPQFVAEDYIDGIELSFEVVVSDSVPFVIGIHEKTDLDESGKTTLESACVSPPVHVSQIEVKQGIQFLRKVMRALRASTGCYHVELRYDGARKRWEVIEVNPRIGGAYIHQSVLITSRGACLLDLWVRTLLASNSTDLKILERDLEMLEPRWMDEQFPEVSSFFRVFFGVPGRIIACAEMRPRSELAQPNLSQVNVSSGTVLPQSEREVFLGQALWELKGRQDESALQGIIEISKSAFHVEYV